MNRRQFFQVAGTATMGGVAIQSCTPSVEKKRDDQGLNIKQLKAWQALQYGMFIHFGMSTFVVDELPDGKAPSSAYIRNAFGGDSRIDTNV